MIQKFTWLTLRSADVSRAGPGLFDSFSESKLPPKLEMKTKKLQKKSTNSNRLKSTKLKVDKKSPTQVLSETLLVQNCVKFVHELTPCRGPLLSPSSLESAAVRSASQATSTPLLGSRSSVRDMVPSIGGSYAAISPMASRQQLEDDVFRSWDDDVIRRSPEVRPGDVSAVPEPRLSPLVLAGELNSSLQEEQDFFEATPPKSFVNRSRGSKKFSGPAASLMNHFGHQGTLACSLQAAGGSEAVTAAGGSEAVTAAGGSEAVTAAGGESVLAESLGVTVRVACVCGSDQVTESKVSWSAALGGESGWLWTKLTWE